MGDSAPPKWRGRGRADSAKSYGGQRSSSFEGGRGIRLREGFGATASLTGSKGLENMRFCETNPFVMCANGALTHRVAMCYIERDEDYKWVRLGRNARFERG